MISAVFLCDKKWKIRKIRQSIPLLPLKVGDSLTTLVAEAPALLQFENEDFSTFLTFEKYEISLSALIHRFPEGYFIIGSKIEGNEDFVAFHREYPKHLKWARECFQKNFQNEYLHIQQINRQLTDAQKILMRTDKDLRLALEENERARQQIQKARNAVEKSQETSKQTHIFRAHFLADMGHELRTPMNTIIGISKLMRYNLESPDVLRSYLDKLQSSSEYLLNLINNILNLGKIESGAMTLRNDPVSLIEQLDQVLTDIRPQITERRQKLSIRTSGVCHDHILTDPERLRQILTNILSNAIQYTPDGGTIDLLLEELPDNRDSYSQYRFTITDNGIGMSPALIRHIFDPFKRSDSIPSELQGTGLGMTITKRLVDAMNGSIRINSTIDQGSQIEVLFAFQQSGQTDSKQFGEQMLTEAHTSDAFELKADIRSLAGQRFLCAEDNKLNAEILSSMLALVGASCTLYPNGKLISDAFASVLPGEYDAILMDVQMPVMDGYEATSRIRNSKNPLGKSIPIIAMTANAFAEDIQKSLDMGMNAHISKPIRLETLAKILQTL